MAKVEEQAEWQMVKGKGQKLKTDSRVKRQMAKVKEQGKRQSAKCGAMNLAQTARFGFTPSVSIFQFRSSNFVFTFAICLLPFAI